MPDSPSKSASVLGDYPRAAEEAIPRLLAEHGGRLYGLGLRLCGSPEEAEELVQEIFLNAFRKWHQFQGQSQPTTWLYTIAARACTPKHRRRSGEPRHLLSLSELTSADGATVPDLPSLEDDPERQWQRRELRSIIESALHEIPMNFRMPLILKDIAELSLAEVAEVLDLKPGTVKTRVHRARLAMRKVLSDNLDQRPARDPHATTVCEALLQAKLEALDRGADFPVDPDLLCDRCLGFFRTLDITSEACQWIGDGTLPPETRRRIEKRLAASEATT